MGSLSHGSWKPGQVSRHGEPPRPRWEFSLKRRGREREKKRERERFDTRGARFPRNQFDEAGLRNWSILYCWKSFLYF